MTDRLSERYGSPARSSRLWAVLGIVLISLAASVWALWVVFGPSSAHVEARDLAHTLYNDENEVSVTWEMSVEAGTETACAIQALNESFQTVGWKVFQIPASEQFTREFTETIQVAMPANTGFVYRCWVP